MHEFVFGSQKHKRYSDTAVQKLRLALQSVSIDELCNQNREARRNVGQARPVNARVMVVASGSKSAKASAHTSFVPASEQRRKAVPIWTALAPKVNAAAIPRPSAMPPAAIIGTES
jgi:hypothetical protein